MTAEHRKPLVAFFLVFAAACMIMGNGMRTQVVEVLIQAGAPPELIIAVSPDMVLGESLSSAPTSHAVREVPATVEGPVQADKDDAKASGNPSPIQAAVESAVESSDSAFVSSRARAAAQKAAAAKLRLRPRRLRTLAPGQPKTGHALTAARHELPRQHCPPPVRSPVWPRSSRPGHSRIRIRCRLRGPPRGPHRFLHSGLPRSPRPPGVPARRRRPQTTVGSLARGRVESHPATTRHHRDHALNRQTRGPERRATGRSASRHAAPARSDRDQHSNPGRGHASRRDYGRDSGPDRSSHSRRHDSHPQAHRGSQRGPGGGGHHDRGGGGGHGPPGHRH